MIELKQITRTFGDGRAGYEVTIDRKYTVKEFINEVISNKMNGDTLASKEIVHSLF